MDTFVFAYGSLTLLDDDAREHHLGGFTRRWGVAMDNRVDVPGYKCYFDENGRRPAVSVAFLDIAEADRGFVNGVLLDVDAESLDVLDRRERNYERVTVTDAITPRPDGQVFAYVGSPAARRRMSDGLADGSCVVDATYLDAVRAGFARLGDKALERFAASTPDPPCPLVPLARRDL